MSRLDAARRPPRACDMCRSIFRIWTRCCFDGTGTWGGPQSHGWAVPASTRIARIALVCTGHRGWTADIAVNGITGRAIVRQTFLNPADAWVEGVYVFPLPEDAAVDRMRLRVDGRIIKGVMAERQVAKKKYREAARADVERVYWSRNVRICSPCPLPIFRPKGRIEVELGYQQAVTRQDGRYSIRFRHGRHAALRRPFRVRLTACVVCPIQRCKDDVDRLAGQIPIRSVMAPKNNPMAIRVVLEPGLPLACLRVRRTSCGPLSRKRIPMT